MSGFEYSVTFLTLASDVRYNSHAVLARGNRNMNIKTGKGKK